MNETVQTATVKLLERYLAKLNEVYNPDNDWDYFDDTYTPPKCGKENLIWMIDTLLKHIDDYPIDKVSRWLGFIQGVMASTELISVDEERDFSRPLFHAAYRNSGQAIPETKELKIR